MGSLTANGRVGAESGAGLQVGEVAAEGTDCVMKIKVQTIPMPRVDATCLCRSRSCSTSMSRRLPASSAAAYRSKRKQAAGISCAIRATIRELPNWDTEAAE
jgi:hypothetical protein